MSHRRRKETLAAEARPTGVRCRRHIGDDLVAVQAPAEALAAIIASYVSAEHRDEPGAGCPTPTLGAEACRRGGAVRAACTGGVSELLESLSQVVPGDTGADRRKTALRILSTLAGALLIARAVDDPGLANEVLGAVDVPEF